MDGQAIPEHLVGDVGVQPVPLMPLQVGGLGLLLGDKLHRGPVHVVHRLHPGDEVLDLGVGVRLVNVGQKFVVVLQLFQVLVHVHGQQRKGPHDQQAGHDHAHRRKGHQPVGEHAQESFLEKVPYVDSFHTL